MINLTKKTAPGANAPEPLHPLIEYEGFVIRCTEHWRFVIEGEEALKEAGGSLYGWESLSEVKAKIDAVVKRRAAVKKVTATMKVLALDEFGETVTWRGLNGNSSKFLTSEPGYEHGLFPNVPEIAALLKRKAELNREMKAITEKTKRYRLPPAHGRIPAETYDKVVTAAVEELGRLERRAVADFKVKT